MPDATETRRVVTNANWQQVVRELRQRRSDAFDRLTDILEVAENQNRALSADEAGEFSELTARVDKFDSEIRAAHRVPKGAI